MLNNLFQTLIGLQEIKQIFGWLLLLLLPIGIIPAQTKADFEREFAEIKIRTNGEDLLNSFRDREFSVIDIPKGTVLVKLLGEGEPDTRNRIFVCHPDQIAGRSKEEIIRLLALPYVNDLSRIQLLEVNQPLKVPAGITAGATWEARNGINYPLIHSANDRNGKAILSGGATQIILLPQHYDKRQITFSKPKPFSGPPTTSLPPTTPPPRPIPTPHVYIQAISQKFAVDKIVDKYHQLPGGVLIESQGKFAKVPATARFVPDRSAFIVDGDTWYYPQLSNEIISILYHHVFFGNTSRLGAVRTDNVVGLPTDCPLAKSFADLDDLLSSIFYGYDSQGNAFPSELAPMEYQNPLDYNNRLEQQASLFERVRYGMDFFFRYGDVRFEKEGGILIPKAINVDVVFCNTENNRDGSETFKATYIDYYNPAETWAILTFVRHYDEFAKNSPLLDHISKAAQLTAFLRALKKNHSKISQSSALDSIYENRLKVPQQFPKAEQSIKPYSAMWQRKKMLIDSVEVILASPNLDERKRMKLNITCLAAAVSVGDAAEIQKYRRDCLDILRFRLATGKNLFSDFSAPLMFIEYIENYQFAKNINTDIQKADRERNYSEITGYHFTKIKDDPQDFESYRALLETLLQYDSLETAKKVYLKGMPYFEAGASAGQPIALKLIALYELSLHGDKEKALKYLDQIRWEDAPAEEAFNIGKQYLQLELTGMAVLWLQIAGHRGNLAAADTLGKICLTLKDTIASIEWLRYNADNGSRFAQTLLYRYYYSHNKAGLARKYVMQAAAQGDEEAILLLEKFQHKEFERTSSYILFALLAIILLYVAYKIKFYKIFVPRVLGIIKARPAYLAAACFVSLATYGLYYYVDSDRHHLNVAHEKNLKGDYFGALKELSQIDSLDLEASKETVVLSNMAIEMAIAKHFTNDMQGSYYYLVRASIIEPFNKNLYFIGGLRKLASSDSFAIADFSREIEINPQNNIAYRERGRAMYELTDNNTEALKDLTKAIELNPKDGVAYVIRGEVKERLKDKYGALQDYDRAIELAPTDYYAYVSRGFIKFYFNDTLEALKALNQALELNPKSDRAFRIRGLVKTSMRDYAGALADLNISIDLDPNYWLAYANRGDVKEFLNDYSGAIKDYYAAIKLNDQKPLPYLRLAIIKTTLGDLTGALHDANRAVEIDSAWPGVILNRGAIKARLGNYADALVDLNRAIRLDESDSYAYLLRGTAYFQISNTTLACDDFAKARSLGNSAAESYMARYCY